MLVPVKRWAAHMSFQRVLIFVDNWPAVDSLEKGVTTQRTWRDLLMILEFLDEEQQSLHWIARVPSASNLAVGEHFQVWNFLAVLHLRMPMPSHRWNPQANCERLS